MEESAAGPAKPGGASYSPAEPGGPRRYKDTGKCSWRENPGRLGVGMVDDEEGGVAVDIEFAHGADAKGIVTGLTGPDPAGAGFFQPVSSTSISKWLKSGV